jgi:hypothetical protein
MKKALVLSMVLLVAVSALAVFAGQESSKMVLKPGDEVYACQCGDSCPCQMMSRHAGKCGCGKEMVKAKVKSVDKDTAVLVFGEREQTFKTVGKYACACKGCDCNSISQTPAKCTCGVDMVEVK